MAEHIDAFHKLKFESDFQRLSPGGAISYIEVPNMQNNIPAVIAVMKYIYENIMYAELNTKSDYCMQCGYDGEIKSLMTKRQTHLGMPELRQPRPAHHVCGKKDMRIHRHPVLEPGPHTGNQRQSPPPLIIIIKIRRRHPV